MLHTDEVLALLVRQTRPLQIMLLPWLNQVDHAFGGSELQAICPDGHARNAVAAVCFWCCSLVLLSRGTEYVWWYSELVMRLTVECAVLQGA